MHLKEAAMCNSRSSSKPRYQKSNIYDLLSPHYFLGEIPICFNIIRGLAARGEGRGWKAYPLLGFISAIFCSIFTGLCLFLRIAVVFVQQVSIEELPEVAGGTPSW